MSEQRPSGAPVDSDPLPGEHPESALQQGPDGSWRRVYFGQVAEPLVPPHPGAPESPEEELTRAALEDPGATVRDIPSLRPTFWRVIVLLVVAVGALAIVFWK